MLVQLAVKTLESNLGAESAAFLQAFSTYAGGRPPLLSRSGSPQSIPESL